MTIPTIPSTYTLGQSLSDMASPFKALFSNAQNPVATPSTFAMKSNASAALSSPLTTKPTVPNMSYANASQNSTPATQNMSYAAPAPKTPTVPSTAGAGSYSIKNGDTLSTIASRYGTTVSQLIANNPQLAANPNMIKVGQMLNLGNAGTPATPSSPAVPSLKTATDGSVINPSTGGVVAGSTSYAPTVPEIASTDTSNPVMPTAPADPLANNPLFTSPEYDAAVAKYEALQAPTDAETQNATDLANLQASYRKAYTNTEGQPIPLEFITGEQKRLQQSATDLAAPLQAQATLLQAKRQAALEASKFAVDTAKSKIDAYRDYNKPTNVAIGTTLVNPYTGTTVFGGGQSEQIGKAIAEGRLTPDMVTRYGQGAILQALQIDPGYNFVTQKASVASDSASLKTQQDYADTTSRAYQTATANLGVLVKFMTDNNINQSGVPLINQLTNKVKSGLADPGAVAAFKSSLEGLRAEYAQVLSRGGQVTDTARNQANSLIPDNISPEQLQKVTTQLSQEGQNAIREANQKVSDIKSRIGSNSGSSKTSGGSTVVQTKVGALDLSTWQ